jgi:hypothetical protein
MAQLWRKAAIGVAMALWALASSAGLASAQVTPAAGYTPPDDTQSIRIGAVIYYDFTTTKEPKSTDADGNQFSPSVFNVSRAYINVTGNISHIVAFRITPDVSRETGTGSSLNGSLTFRIKYAYAQLNLDDWTGNWKGSWVRLGIQQTPFIDWEEGIYRYRFQGTVFVEREQIGGNLTSSDAGVSFHSNFPGNFGEVHAGVYNGEGYGRAEVNGQKAFQIRGTVRPLAKADSLLARGIRVTAFYDADHYIKNGERNRFVFNVISEHTHYTAGYDFLDGEDRQPSARNSLVESQGWSLWVTPILKEKGNGWEGLLRMDRFKPNTTTLSGQEKQRAIAGIAYWFPHPGGGATASLLFDFEQLKFDGFPTTVPANATQQRYAVHGLISF